MANIIAIAKLLLSLGPAIIGFMVELEKLFPADGQGAKKLEMLKGFVESMWSTFGSAVPAFENVWPTIQVVVAAVKSIGKGTLFAKPVASTIPSVKPVEPIK